MAAGTGAEKRGQLISCPRLAAPPAKADIPSDHLKRYAIDARFGSRCSLFKGRGLEVGRNETHGNRDFVEIRETVSQRKDTDPQRKIAGALYRGGKNPVSVAFSVALRNFETME